jgi:hypothetical protein
MLKNMLLKLRKRYYPWARKIQEIIAN